MLLQSQCYDVLVDLIIYMSPLAQQMRWETVGRAPEQMVTLRGSGTTAVDGNTVYVAPGYSHHVWAYDLKEDKWTRLRDCPHRHARLCVVNGLLTAVGGWTNTLVSLTESQKWTEHFPPMPVELDWPAVVCTGNHLVVARERKIHVMDTTSLKWFSASGLPFPLRSPSLTVCGTELYVLDYKSVFSCSLPTLLQSSTAVQQETSDVWRELADVPVGGSTLTTLCGQLVAVGGLNNVRSESIDSIHLYNPSKNSWHLIGHMPTARSSCLVATLPGDTLVVIGGFIRRRGSTARPCDVVEVAYPV